MQAKWNYTPLTPDERQTTEALAERLGMSRTTASLLLRRGIKSEAAARRFLRPQLTELHDPFLMNDMDVAVDRLNVAMGRRERIMVYGDYDVDGCTAVALVYRFLSQIYNNIEYYIPDRYVDGYGVSRLGIDHAAEAGVGLIIVLDCGIKANDEIAYARERGIDFIVCDHHVPDEQLPDAVAILNPKREDNTYPYRELCGCGVGFKFMQAFAKSNGIHFNRLLPLLDYCAVSIASDLVPVTGENRILAYHGLKQLNTQPSVGIKAIIETCGLAGREITMSDIVFKIAPRINASGRMQNGTEAVNLMVETDAARALVMAEQINRYNEQRKDVDRQMTEEANQIVERLDSQEHLPAIVVYDEHWKKGVVGIVASRLTELYYRPTVVLSLNGDLATGSARSVAGIDVYSAVKSCRDLLANFGGHTYAVGLSMPVQNVPEFRRRFQQYIAGHILPQQTEAVTEIEAVLDFRDVNKRLMNELKKLAPHGPGNPKPLFATRGVYDFGTSKVVGRNQEHIKLELVDSRSSNVINGIAFGQSAAARYIKSRRSFDIIYTIEENIYKRGEVQLQIEGIRPSETEE
ncbi:MAG: single-stranded-DNA-specific exonuclease RecJ [Prevotella sp.]|nr:single-stranded-DNA-specific exonuclease RecJ [Prevotella sp.]